MGKMRVSVSGDVDFMTGQAITDIIDNKRGMLYSALTYDIRMAILRNADSSYTDSPAKDIALESCNDWQHSPGHHRLDVMSTDYANYRQYQCGGIPKAVLVDLAEADIEAMANDIVRECDNEMNAEILNPNNPLDL